MSRILVLGGYGGFGARISRRLAASGHEVLVAGRSTDRAIHFCREVGGTVPLQLDRSNIGSALRQHRPEIVVDASGPFQFMDYAVPQACIAAGINYCDIADGREFVCGIGHLDEAARTAGVTVISGASSVPALSGAVVRELAEGLDQVTAVEMAITASNRATAGPAVARAILGQVGRSLRVFRAGRWVNEFGWQEQIRLDFVISGRPPLRRRLIALADVPDLGLLPDRLPGRPACTFRAGTELRLHNRALWLGSWLVRFGLVESLASLAPVAERLQRLTASWGSDRSAMIVRLFGHTGTHRLERRWTLIANRGDGPEIPSLSVPLVVDRILSGSQEPGARDAGNVLRLQDYGPAFERLAIATETVEIEMPSPPYLRVMGPDFDSMPATLRRLHSPLRDAGASGEAVVNGAPTRIGRLIARLMRFPPPGRHKLHVEFCERDGVERWTRDFAGHRFSSELQARGGLLEERFGPLRFRFKLPLTADGFQMVMREWSAFGIRLPLRLAPRSQAREWEDNGTFHFDVPIALPLIGNIVHYRGWLQLS